MKHGMAVVGIVLLFFGIETIFDGVKLLYLVSAEFDFEGRAYIGGLGAALILVALCGLCILTFVEKRCRAMKWCLVGLLLISGVAVFFCSLLKRRYGLSFGVEKNVVSVLSAGVVLVWHCRRQNKKRIGL